MKKSRIPILMALILLFAVLSAGCKTTEEAAPKPSVAVGTWIETQKIAEKDGAPHPIKYRIDAIVRDPQIVDAAIERYNLSGTGNLIGQLEDDKLEFCMAEYSAFYPKDFPQRSYGITDVAVAFEVVSLAGGDIQVGDTVYQSLSSTWEIGEAPQGYDFHRGDTYHGRIIFIMVKGYSDYLIHEIKPEAAGGGQNYIRGE